MEPKYEVVTRDDQPDIYAMMDALIGKHHKHLVGAEVRIAYYVGWNPDVDGRLTLGRCKIASELDRRLHGCQVIIVLNRDAWDHFAVAQQEALLDHELCHAEVKLDKDLQPVEDENGRSTFRIRKHDIEEFRSVVERHGIWLDDLRDFAETVIAAQKRLPFEAVEKGNGNALADAKAVKRAVEKLRPKKGSGIDSLTITVPGGESVTLEAQ